MLTSKHLLFQRLESEKITAVNKRVKSYDTKYGSASGTGLAYEGIGIDS